MKGAWTPWLTSHRAKQGSRPALRGNLILVKCEWKKALISAWLKPNLFPVERHCGYWGVMGSPWTLWAIHTPWSLQGMNFRRGRSWVSSSTAGTVLGIPCVILALGSLWTQAIVSVKGSKPLNSAHLQSLAVYQNTGDCSLLFSIAFSLYLLRSPYMS